MGVDKYYISTRTFIVAVTTSYEFCEDSEKSQTTSINVFYVICQSLSGKTLQSYEKYMTFANEILKIHKIYARKYKF